MTARTSGTERPTARRGRRTLAAATLLVAMLVPATRAVAQPPPAPDRVQQIVGAITLEVDTYTQTYSGAAPHDLTKNPRSRVAGFPVRQHPVNLGLFDQGCAHCHRLAGPLPPGANMPADVFDQLVVSATSSPVPPRFTRLTDSPAREEYPSWSPSGGHLLYEARGPSGAYQLWLMRADGSDPQRISDQPSAGWSSWHPSGRSIAFWASDAAGRGNIWTYDLASDASRRRTDHAMTAWPTWSPDGTTLAYQVRDRAEQGWRLHLLDVASGRSRVLAGDAETLPSRPLWSPDGQQLLYQSLTGVQFELNRLVFAVDAAGHPDYASEPRRANTPTGYPVDLGAASQRPAWNPSDRRIAFVMYTIDVVPPSTLAYTYKTWTIESDGTRPHLVLPDATLADRSPTWNASGTWLAQWSWGEDLSAQVWLVDGEGARRVHLTEDLGGDALYPAWSPDGTRVAFASNRAGDFDIWVADVADIVGEGAMPGSAP